MDVWEKLSKSLQLTNQIKLFSQPTNYNPNFFSLFTYRCLTTYKNTYIFHFYLFFFSMQTILTNHSVPTFSKMGRYISTRILPSKIPSSHKKVKNKPPFRSKQVKNIKKRKKKSFCPSSYKKQEKRGNSPGVGYYKINYNQVDKQHYFYNRNIRLYNFNRSVPHFSREKYHCFQTNSSQQSIPDLAPYCGQIKGLVTLNKMIGRSQAKSGIAKIKNVHQKRFVLAEHHSPIGKKSAVNMKKCLGRKKIVECKTFMTPFYAYDFEKPKKRLNTHIIPFQLQLARNNEYLKAKTGISDFFCMPENDFSAENYRQKIPLFRSVKWKNGMGREITGQVPSFMDKSINSRMGLELINLKTLEMNCTSMREKAEVKEKQKERVLNVQEENVLLNLFD